MDLNLVNTFTQWLYVVSDTDGQNANVSSIAPLITEGSNIAIAYNTTTTDPKCAVSFPPTFFSFS